MKHSHGTWKLSTSSKENIAFQITNGDSEIAFVAEQMHVGTEKSNAALISAAPELLAALIEFSGVWERGEKFADMDVDAIESMRARARSAIAKAIGEQK